MVDRTLVERAKGLAVADRWELAVELWASMEGEDFPIESEVEALLLERLAEAESTPPVGRTWDQIKAARGSGQR